jgi:hypothetical protein
MTLMKTDQWKKNDSEEKRPRRLIISKPEQTPTGTLTLNRKSGNVPCFQE